LSLHVRLYNYFRSSGATEEKVESFIANVSTGDASPEKIIELVNHLFNISKAESIPLDQIPNYIERKLEEKQKIDERIKEADTLLQSKSVTIEAINEHLQLNEKLKEHGLSTHDIDKLLNLLVNAKRYGFDGKELAAKLYDFKFLEWKEKEFKDKRKKLSKRMLKFKDIIPFTEEIVALGIGINDLLAFKIGINQAAKYYNLPFISATMRLIEDIKTYNKINDIKKELSVLQLQKYTLSEACSRQSQSLVALAKLKSYGLTEDRILELNNFLENNVYKDMKPNI
jgi:cell division septum initiation protein DivIVA